MTERELQNAVRWCLRQRKKAKAFSIHYNFDKTCSDVERGRAAAYDHAARYLNKKLPKDKRVKR